MRPDHEITLSEACGRPGFSGRPRRRFGGGVRGDQLHIHQHDAFDVHRSTDLDCPSDLDCPIDEHAPLRELSRHVSLRAPTKRSAACGDGDDGRVAPHPTSSPGRDNPPGAVARAARLRVAAFASTLLVAAGCGSGSGGTAGAKRDAGATGLVSIGAGLRGPAGLKATVYATGLGTASAFALDRRGRLWVTTSAASGHANDGVYLVPRVGATPVKVVAGLQGPLGLTWSHEQLYVASIGRVDAFGDLRGTHFQRRTTILREPAGHGWNDNIVQAPDGRMVMSISSPCDHCASSSAWSASIVSFRHDGSGAQVYADAVRAGYGLVYFPGTSDLFVTMNQRNDLGARTPGDWLAVVQRGQNWGYPGCFGQGGAVCRGVPQPTAVLDKHAAAGGVAIVTGQLGAAVGTAAIVPEWNTGRVMRVALTRSGRTWTGSATPFLTGLKNPLPVMSTGDGALLLGDWSTGTIYRIARS